MPAKKKRSAAPPASPVRGSPVTPASGSGAPSAVLINAARAFLLLAAGISTYLAWVSLHQGQVIGCSPDMGCDRVLQSRWSHWFGLPVSLLALPLDLLLLVATFRVRPEAGTAAELRMRMGMVTGSCLLIGAGLWFVGLQLFLLHAMCPYCMVAHAAGMAASVLLLVAWPGRGEATSRGSGVAPGWWFARSGAVAALALAILIVGQIVHQSSGGGITIIPVAGGMTSAPPARVAAAPVRRVFPVYGGRIELNLQEVPVLGSPTNEGVAISLFDYTCHHCRSMHALLREIQQTFSNQLVLVNLPMPLEPDCNPTMQRPHPLHTNACAYARLGLTVWRADRSRHHEFDDWLMTGERPPSLAEARSKAIQVVGAAAWERASLDPWVDEQLRKDVALYEVAYQARQGSMPQFIIGPVLAVGTKTREELLQLLETHLGLKTVPMP